MKRLREKSMNALEGVAVRATRWIGSPVSILVHTIFFIVAFILYFWGVAIDKILLVVTTLVSLEAIYLSIFIQMSMNLHARRLHEVAQDVEEIQEDVEEIQKDVEEINEDEEEEATHHSNDDAMFNRIENTLGKLMEEITELKKNQK